MRNFIIFVSIWTKVVGNESLIATLRNMESAPPYIDSYKSLANCFRQVMESLPTENLMLTDVRRHYVMVTGVLAGLVEYLNSNCTPQDYEHQYLPIVDLIVPVIWQDPLSTANKIKDFIYDTTNLLNVIKDLSGFYCSQLTDETCNKILHILVQEADLLNKAAKVVLLGGELAKLQQTDADIKNELQEYDTVSVLIKGKDRFKPLVFKAAEMYRILYGETCHTR